MHTRHLFLRPHRAADITAALVLGFAGVELGLQFGRWWGWW